MTPEKRVAAPSDAWLKEIGAYVFKPVQMGMGATTLDRLCCISGKFVAIEYKAPGKIPTTRQQFVMGEIRRAGGIAIWGDSAEQIVEKLKQALGLPDG